METNPLVGTWRLVSWQDCDDDGDVSYPLGQDAIGYLIYTADGRMMVEMMRAGRTAFQAGDLLSGEPAEEQAAEESFVAYSGRYHYVGDRVLHDVDISLFPNWLGTQQERFVQLEGDRMTLSLAPVKLEGRIQSAVLVWERVPADA